MRAIKNIGEEKISSDIFTNHKTNTLLRDFDVALTQSHHLYDFVQMVSTNIVTRAIANEKLWNTIIHQHKSQPYQNSGVFPLVSRTSNNSLASLLSTTFITLSSSVA